MIRGKAGNRVQVRPDGRGSEFRKIQVHRCTVFLNSLCQPSRLREGCALNTEILNLKALTGVSPEESNQE